MNVSIVGSGQVGERVGRGLRSLGHDVIFYDLSDERVQELREEGLTSSNDLDYAVQNSEISFLSVPTPTEKERIDLAPIGEASRNLGSHLATKDGYHVVVVKSTVVPGTTRGLVIPSLEDESGKRVGEEIGVCTNPEFMTEISESWTDDEGFEKGFFSGDRIVIGEHSSAAGDVLEKLYVGLDTPIIRTDLRTAEMIKYACNCMLATKISYWNEIFRICERLEIDSEEVARVASMDERIGVYGTVHGKAFGGKCLPKDLRAFIHFVEDELNFEPELLRAVESINEFMAKEHGVRE